MDMQEMQVLIRDYLAETDTAEMNRYYNKIHVHKELIQHKNRSDLGKILYYAIELKQVGKYLTLLHKVDAIDNFIPGIVKKSATRVNVPRGKQYIEAVIETADTINKERPDNVALLLTFMFKNTMYITVNCIQTSNQTPSMKDEQIKKRVEVCYGHITQQEGFLEELETMLMLSYIPLPKLHEPTCIEKYVQQVSSMIPNTRECYNILEPYLYGVAIMESAYRKGVNQEGADYKYLKLLKEVKEILQPVETEIEIPESIIRYISRKVSNCQLPQVIKKLTETGVLDRYKIDEIIEDSEKGVLA